MGHGTLLERLPLEGWRDLILVTPEFCERPHEQYEKRWCVENLFGALKSRGFNLEDTKLQDSERLSRLLALLALALTSAFVVGIWEVSGIELKLKIHGYPSKSIFRCGLNILCRQFQADRSCYLADGYQTFAL